MSPRNRTSHEFCAELTNYFWALSRETLRPSGRMSAWNITHANLRTRFENAHRFYLLFQLRHWEHVLTGQIRFVGLQRANFADGHCQKIGPVFFGRSIDACSRRLVAFLCGHFAQVLSHLLPVPRAGTAVVVVFRRDWFRHGHVIVVMVTIAGRTAEASKRAVQATTAAQQSSRCVVLKVDVNDTRPEHTKQEKTRMKMIELGGIIICTLWGAIVGGFKASLHWGVARSSRSRFFLCFYCAQELPSRARAQNYPTQQNKESCAATPGNSSSVDWPLLTQQLAMQGR